MKSGVKVMDAMTINPVIVHPDELLKDCSQKMAEQHVGALIVKEKNKVHGICTEQDIVRKTVALGKNPLKMKVKDIMDQNVRTIEPYKDIFEALLLMRDLNIRHLPVVEG
ncbi:MAG: CBS domain-containing protein, partial [Nanoarchaeota archaeon]|nr:CBS domain-containing protein [Nanoarchaeota archaeon]